MAIYADGIVKMHAAHLCIPVPTLHLTALIKVKGDYLSEYSVNFTSNVVVCIHSSILYTLNNILPCTFQDNGHVNLLSTLASSLGHM